MVPPANNRAAIAAKHEARERVYAYLHGPFHTRRGSIDSAFSTMTRVDSPQNAGSACVVNCSISFQKEPSPSPAIAAANSAASTGRDAHRGWSDSIGRQHHKRTCARDGSKRPGAVCSARTPRPAALENSTQSAGSGLRYIVFSIAIDGALVTRAYVTADSVQQLWAPC